MLGKIFSFKNGFNEVLSTFFDSWQELSLNPESSSARTALIENSNLLLNSIRQTYNSLATVRDDIKANIELKVNEVNSLAVQISDLNQQITSLATRNDQPSDLMDRRDLLLEQLSKIIDFDTTATSNGSINILVAGRPLVHESTSYELVTKPGGSTSTGWVLSPEIVWSKDEQTANISSGEIYGLSQLRDDNLCRYMEDFESLAWGIVNVINDVHSTGSDLNGNMGLDFFTGDHLQNLEVNPLIIDNPALIAAAAATTPGMPLPGDGSNAVLIAQLRNASFRVDKSTPQLNQRLIRDANNGTTTLEFFYRDTIARLGVDAQESSRMTENQNSLLELMTNRRLSISGVSLDEEMANMVQFQLAYQASARFLATLDEIYNTLINGILR